MMPDFGPPPPRKRYIPSDVGPTPESWLTPRLEQISTLITNGFVGTATPFYTDESGVKYLYGQNVRENRIDEREIRFITQEFHTDQSKTRLREGDLLTVQSGHIGVTAVVPHHMDGTNCHALIVTRLKKKYAVPEFVSEYLKSEIGKARLRGLKVGSTILHINTKELKKFLVPLPTLSEQVHMVEIFKAWARAIEIVEALVANARTQKMALMQSLLTGKTRLPGFSDEWATLKLGVALAERSERGGDELPLLSVTQAEGIIHQDQAGRKNISSADQSNYKTVRTGDIAYNTMRMWQGASALSALHGKVSPAYTIVTPRKGHDAHFYAYMFKWPSMIHVFERHSQGLVSDTWNLKYPHFSKIRVRVPEFEEQAAIRRVLEAADASLAALKNQLAALRQEKSALMQQLLTGKRRVKVDFEGETC